MRYYQHNNFVPINMNINMFTFHCFSVDFSIYFYTYIFYICFFIQFISISISKFLYTRIIYILYIIYVWFSFIRIHLFYIFASVHSLIRFSIALPFKTSTQFALLFGGSSQLKLTCSAN